MAIRRCWYHLGMLCWSSLLLAGCDDTSASRPASTPSATPTSASPPAPIPAPQPEPKVSFASLDAGVAAFQEACEARDGEQITATMRWLADQGPAAVAPMGRLAGDPAADAGTRVAATRVLALIGAAATDELLAASQSSEPLVRAKAAESLGSIRPATTPILDRLLVLLDDDDHQVRSATIRSLQRIGPQAKRAAPQLQAILNSDAPEQLRQEAHAALKKIAPRVGFRQGEADE